MVLTNTAKHFTEPACGFNTRANRVCERPWGGESCVFDGAYVVLNPIKDTAHLIHGPIGCCGNLYESRGSLSSGSRLYRYGFTTDMTEMDIVYGAEGKLLSAIEYIADRYSPSAIFVYSTCIPSLTGEDVEGVCRKGYGSTGIPVIPVIVPGFLGHKNLGNRIAGEVLLEHVIGRGNIQDGSEKVPSINLIGEYNIAGELWNVLPVFEEIGVRVISTITGDAEFREITCAHHADLNLLVCGRALINVARDMEERFGIPFVEVSFYGIGNMERTLTLLASHFKDRRLYIRIKEVISVKRKETEALLKPYLKVLKGKRAVVYTGGVKSWSIISALNDLGVEVVACGTKKSSLSDIEKIKALIGEERIIKDLTPDRLLSAVHRERADILIAGGRNQYLAYKERIPFIDINQERHTPYAGYRGIVNLARDMVKTITSPVWKMAGKEEPW